MRTIRTGGWCAALVALVFPLAGCGQEKHAELAEVTVESSVAEITTEAADSGTMEPQKPQPPTSGGGTMQPVYEEASSPSAVDGRAFMQSRNMLERFADDINNTLNLPYDIPLQGKQCDESNLYWSPADKAVVICYESVTRLGGQFTDLGDPDPEQAVYDTVQVGFFHESGHMAIDIYDLPAVGREEDDADQVSVYLMLRPNAGGTVDASQVQALDNAMKSFAADGDQQGVDDAVMADVHSPTKARLFNLECWAYGADPEYGEALVNAGLLPEDRAQGCPAEYGKLRSAWDRLLAPYLK